MTDRSEPVTKTPPITLDLRRDELEIGVAIFRKLSVGEDVRQLASTAAAQGLYIKLVRAKRKVRED